MTEVSSSQPRAIPPGNSDSRISGSRALDTRFHHGTMAHIEGAAFVMLRATMSRNGTLFPCPFTSRILRNPWWARLFPMPVTYRLKVSPSTARRDISVEVSASVAGHRLPDLRPGELFIAKSGGHAVLIIFAHGCFWYRHPSSTCKLARLPKSRLDFWQPKLEQNRQRDVEAQKKLKRDGWRILAIWECEIKSANLADKIERFLEAD